MKQILWINLIAVGLIFELFGSPLMAQEDVTNEAQALPSVLNEAIAGGIADSPENRSVAAVADVIINDTILDYESNETKNRNETTINNVSFSSFYYLFPTNLISLTNVKYNAGDATCTRTGDVRIDCNGRINKFEISYEYAYSYPPVNGIVRYSTGFRSFGFSFSGDFNIFYPEDDLNYISAEVTPLEHSGNRLTWSKSNTSSIRVVAFFDLLCVLTEYSASQFVGDPVVAHIDFVPALNKINNYAKEADVKILVTSSFRTTTDVPGAIVTPAKRSNHLVGYAIDMNVKYGSGHAQLCNSKCLSANSLPASVQKFIDAIRSDPQLRFGGDFSKSDPVHIDQALNLTAPDVWLTTYAKAQANPTCRLNKPVQPKVMTNYLAGQAGSTFTVIGVNYPADASGSIEINGKGVGTIQTQADGSVVFHLQTSRSNKSGVYDLQLIIDETRSHTAEINSQINIATQRFSLTKNGTLYRSNPDVSTSLRANLTANVEPLSIIFLPLAQSTD